ncbi:50S ribosomal protein L6 [Kiloniella laminariae]|uniref:Large ribosomal subunit protein uL6 n=1 Tax=Kiloniella laminariae TaxID=454162 RepID=A0ABT4LST8_9PROT|nr:50S ribosomal protein L6 [Kiloniella laminariae]MCZ4283002.1 50S ribosomal protein L6 [Kiloniella laminariae]
MSRVGKNPVEVPGGVEVKVDGNVVTAKGKLGQLSFAATDDVSISLEEGKVVVKPANDSKRARSMWGTARSRVENLVIGVSQGYTKSLEINGVGYRAAVQGNALNLQLGFSHDVNYPIPEGISIVCEKPTAVAVSGIDKQKVGQVAAEIRAYRPPEPYKGKGVKYADEVVLRKEGKKK